MKYLSFLSLCLFATLFVSAQDMAFDSTAHRFGKSITEIELEQHLSILASDEYQGRETGEKGQKMAAEYIAKLFKSLGFIPGNPQDETYFQDIPLQESSWDSPTLSIDGKTYDFLGDFYGFPGTTSSYTSKNNNVVFLGYGIDDEKYSDYTTDVTGKVVVVFDGEPQSEAGIYRVTGNTEPSKWSTKWQSKLEAATENGASMLLIVDTDLKKNVARYRPYLSGGGMKLQDGLENKLVNTFYISQNIFNQLFKAKKVNKRIRLITDKGLAKAVKSKKTIDFDIKKEVKKFSSENVLGFIEGTDLKDEILVITSHYDHIGMDGDKIFNGADDDGSGTVALLEIAEAFAKAKSMGHGPRRSILFMTVSGEEKGLLGSEHYVTNPLYPLDMTVADLNIDMIGRTGDQRDDNDAEDRNYVYIIGSDKLSTELHAINETANKLYTNMTLDYTYNDPDDPNRFYYRSDHYNFAKNDIPIIFYFNGTHADYHKETDTIEKIEFDMLAKRAQLVFYTAWQLVNQDKRIEVDVFDAR